MENPTPFDLNEALRRWRAEFTGPSSLNAAELEELEAHLRDHVSALEAEGMLPAEAFGAAANQLGDRRQVATEFAKVNPQRIWLERGMWMAAGILFFDALLCLSLVPGNIVLNLGLRAQWPLVWVEAAASLAKLVTIAAAATLCWRLCRKRPRWIAGAASLCVRRPWIMGIALVLALKGAGRLPRDGSRILDWILPASTPVILPDESMMMRLFVAAGIVENVLWATALCLLASCVLRARRRQNLSPISNDRSKADYPLWTERALWMVAGSVLARFVRDNSMQFGILPAMWLRSHFGASVLMQHLLGLLTAALIVALVVMPFWVFWRLATRCPKLGDWLNRTFEQRPLMASLGLGLIFSLTAFWALFMLWTGTMRIGPGLSAAEFSWSVWTNMLIQAGPVALLLVLLRWRMKLREAS